ncbi:CHAT domain-containing protein [Kitasatospora aureofaciens]|uniref:CHAT domain-containing protein n=1 Tax=Kitasatospora aureofaciens TaxID=1894 RepID=UPI0036F48B02
MSYPGAGRVLAAEEQVAGRLLQRGLQGSLPALGRAVAAWAKLAAELQPGHPRRAAAVVNYCCALVRSFEVQGGEESLDEAISLLRAELRVLEPERRLEKARTLGTLGWALLRKAEHCGDRALADEAVAVRRGACSCMDRRDAEYAQHLTDLGSALASRAALTGSVADLREAIDVHKGAVRRTGNADAERATRWAGLGTASVSLFEWTGDAAALEAGVACHRKALAEVLSSEPLSLFRSNLGVALGICYDRTGDVTVLEEAIACHRAALEAAPPGHFGRPRCLMSLATALQTRFEATGELAWLNEAIDVFRQAIATVDGAADHPQYARSLCGLAGALVLRYQHIGDSDSLHEALWRFDEGLAATPVGHPNRPTRLSSQSVARYHAFQDKPSMYGQITAPVREAIALVPATHAQRGFYLSNLGAYLNTHYERSGDDTALTEALMLHEEAVATTPADHVERGKRIANWAVSLTLRAHQTKDVGDADRAVTVCTEALEAVRSANPQRAQCLQVLSEALTLRADLTGNPGDRARALAAYQEAADDDQAPTLMRIRAAEQLGHTTARSGDAPAALRAFSQAVSLIGQAAWSGLDHEAQAEILQHLAHLPEDAAALAIESGDLERAVELLEEGRGILLAQTLDDDTSYQRIHARAPEQAERLKEISTALAHLPQPVSSQPDERDYALPRHRSPMDTRTTLAAQRDALVAQLRQIPGLEDAFRPPRFADLQDAGALGPVVIVNISSYRCDAIAITPRGLGLIPLPGLTRDNVDEYARTLQEAVRTAQAATQAHGPAHVAITKTFTRIWETVTAPILRALEITAPADPTASAPRLWWCPTGSAAALPLHAAGHPPNADHHDGALDRVTSSYTPTLRALQHQRSHPGIGALPDPRPLIVAMPSTPDQRDLPGAQAETDDLTRRCPEHHLLAEQAATIDAVTAAMQDHAWTHFSCHGERAPHTHDGGRLLLHDGPLTAPQIAAADVPDGALAFVSACATYSSTGDGFDECLSVGSAMQLAGYRHVIATLWPVYDTSTVDLTRAVYDHLLDTQGPGGLRLKDSAAALRSAALQARRRTPDDPTRWAPYLHLGPE